MSGEETRDNPFVGLRPFDEDDSLYLFGRDRHTADILNLLRLHHFVGVVGGSGSGKSSLVRAGVLPSLLAGFLVGDRDHWYVATMRPGDQPIVELADALKTSGAAPGANVEELAQDIRRRHEGAIFDVVRPQMSDRHALIVLVDQFEEIFHFRGPDADTSTGDTERERVQRARRGEAADFVAVVMALARQSDLPIYVVLTMRSDFLGNCEVFFGLPEALNEGRFLVSRMTRQELRGAVSGPAILENARLSARLVDRVLNDLGDRFDQLPLLQHALQRTWEAWAKEAAAKGAAASGQIDFRHYETAGTLHHALEQEANEALTEANQAAVAAGTSDRLVERIFRQLTDTDALGRQVRRPLRLNKLADAVGASRDEVRCVLEPFWKKGRNFLYKSDDADPRVDISHESLMRQWTCLGTWVDTERDWRDTYLKLAGRAGGARLQEPDLDVFLKWREAAPVDDWAKRYDTKAPMAQMALEYLESSRQRRDETIAREQRLLRERAQKQQRALVRYRVVTGLVGALLLTLAASTLRYYRLSASLVPQSGGLVPPAVTWGQFNNFLDMIETNWVARFRHPKVDATSFRKRFSNDVVPDQAVGYVNWHEANAFCDSVGRRLPKRGEIASAPWDSYELWTVEVDGDNVERRYVVSAKDGVSVEDAWNRRKSIGFRCVAPAR